MTAAAIIMLIVSAVLHAGWNLLTKSRHPTASFFMVANLAAALCLSPLVLLNPGFLSHGVSPRVWCLLTATGFFMALYYVALAAAYRSGQMSVAYPLARAVPVLLVAVVTFLVGRGQQVTVQFLCGAALIVLGCLLLPMHRFRDLRGGFYLTRTCLLALLAAVGTAGYSMIDDEALRLLRGVSAGSMGTVEVTLFYACLEGLITAVWLLLVVGLRRDSRADFVDVVKRDRWLAVGAGFMIYLTYSIVLVSLAFVANVSYVVAFRQLSIPLGAAFGIALLKEPPHTPKLVGVGLMFVGLVLVATG